MKLTALGVAVNTFLVAIVFVALQIPAAADDVVETIWIPVTAGSADELKLEATLYGHRQPVPTPS